MRKRSIAVMLLALVAGCTTQSPSPVADKAKVGITSRVIAGGAPVEGAHVTLQAGGSLSDLLAFLPPVNLVCLGGACDTTDEGAVTHADGRLDLRTTGQATKTLTGGARTMALTASDPTLPAGAVGRGAVAHSFKVLTERVALPDLVLWRASPTFSPGRVGYAPPPAASAVTRLYLDDAQGNTIAVLKGDTRSVSYDRRLIEDFVTRLVLIASVSSGGVDTDWRAATYEVRGALRPASRGAACSVPGGHRVSPCGLTDGDLATSGPPPALDCSTVPEGQDTTCADDRRSTDIDLGTTRALSLVVVRGARRAASLSTSSDGRHWTPVPQPRVTAPLDSRTTYAVPVHARARYLRVTSDDDLTEVSAW